MNNAALFVTRDDKYPTIARLAGFLFAELQAFGVLTSVLDVSEESVQNYISARAGFTCSFLQTLENACGLRFAPETRIPFCYNTTEWNKAAPIAGYTSGTPGILPSEVATSLVLNAMVRARGALGRRLLTCALWYLQTNGLREAMDYLFDLHRSGFAGYRELHQTVAMLLSGRSQAGSDQDFLRTVLGRPPEEVTDWVGLNLETDLSGDHPLDADGKEVLSALFAQADQEIERVRAAVDLDQWIVGQAYLGGLLRVTIKLIRELIAKPSLPWRARLSQWEEIQADVIGMITMAQIGMNPLSPRYRRDYAQGIGTTIRDKVGEGWEERLFQERLVVPAALREDFASGTDEPMSPQWDHLSWRVIFPWTIGIENKDVVPAARVAPVSADELMDNAGTREFLKSSGVADPAEQLVVLTRYLGDQGSDPLTQALTEVAPLDSSTFSRELLLNGFEILVQLNAEGQYGAAAARAAVTIARHPWFGPAYQELAIARDHQGDPQLAVASLLSAIALAPRSPFPWRSLAVVLQRTDSSDEALFAAGFCHYLESANSGQ